MPDFENGYENGYNFAAKFKSWNLYTIEQLMNAVDIYKQMALSTGNAYYLGMAAYLWQLVLNREVMAA